MSNFEDFLQGLNPKVAKSFNTARGTVNGALPAASISMTRDLNGGFGRGRISLVYGPPSAGKSALMQQSMGKWQEEGLVVAYVDSERTWDNEWAERLGVNVDETVLIQAKSTAKVYNTIKPLLEGGIDAIVIDSISMLMPDDFIDDDGLAKGLENQKQIGAHAKSITRLCNALHFSNDNTAIILLSQTTTDLSGMHPKQVPHGGRKIWFATSQVVKLNSSMSDKMQIKDNVYVGNKIMQLPVARNVDYLIEKNKMGPQGGTGTYRFNYRGETVGIDYVGEVIAQAVSYDVIKKGGAWYSKGDLKWQGEDKVRNHYLSLPDDFAELVQEVEDVING